MVCAKTQQSQDKFFSILGKEQVVRNVDIDNKISNSHSVF